MRGVYFSHQRRQGSFSFPLAADGWWPAAVDGGDGAPESRASVGIVEEHAAAPGALLKGLTLGLASLLLHEHLGSLGDYWRWLLKLLDWLLLLLLLLATASLPLRM